MPITQWLPVPSSTPITDAEFRTHSNYLKCVNHLSNGLSLITVPDTSTASLSISQVVSRKRVLINLTRDNMIAEYGQINSTPDYSQICVSWIPVKSYYLFFNLSQILIYLITNEQRWLTENHADIKSKFKDLLRSGSISFSHSSFNNIYSPNRIKSWQIPSGNNVIVRNLNYSILEKQTIKIMYKYCKDDYKGLRKIARLGGARLQQFDNSQDFNLCDFFYWYRIKANYRDMEFLNTNISIFEFQTFYREYYTLSMNFYTALKTEINRLSQLRFQLDILS